MKIFGKKIFLLLTSISLIYMAFVVYMMCWLIIKYQASMYQSIKTDFGGMYMDIDFTRENPILIKNFLFT